MINPHDPGPMKGKEIENLVGIGNVVVRAHRQVIIWFYSKFIKFKCYLSFLARKFKKKENDPPLRLLDDLFRKTKITPCIYWLPLTAEQVFFRMIFEVIY